MRIFRPMRYTVSAVLAIAAIVSLLPGAPTLAQMTGGMREMMQRMMGDVLPPGIDPKLLPVPESRGALLLGQYCTRKLF